MVFSFASLHNHFVRIFKFVSRSVSSSRLTPGGFRMHSFTRPSFPTAVRMRSGILSGSLDSRPDPHMSFPTGFAQIDIFPLRAANLTYGGISFSLDTPDLTRR